MYNMSSQMLFNLSSAGYSYFGSAGGGMAPCVPNPGVGGLLLSIGGWNTADQEVATTQYVSLYSSYS